MEELITSIIAFLRANWPYGAAGMCLLWAYIIWEINRAPIREDWD